MISTKRDIRLWLVIGLLLSCGCAASITNLVGMPPEDSPDDLIYVDGNDVLMSTKAETQASVMAQKRGGERGYYEGSATWLKLRVCIQNISDHRVNVFPDSVKVRAMDKYLSGEDMRVYSPKKYMEKISMQQSITYGLMAAGKIMGTALSTAGETKTRSTTTGYIGNSTINLSTSERSIDYSKREDAHRQDAAELREAGRGMAEAYTRIEMALLKKHTLFPGDVIEGDVFAKLEYVPGKEVVPWITFAIRIRVGEDLHKFAFQVPRKE